MSVPTRQIQATAKHERRFPIGLASAVYLARAVIIFILIATLSTPAVSQGLRPYEPLDPAKAQSLQQSPLVIENEGHRYKFIVELANTPEQQAIGLMHRNYMAPDHGMLFDSGAERRTRFWMRNTFIPLDMLFILSNGTVVYIAENTTPHSENGIGPDQPVEAVLELAGGTAMRLGLKVGATVHHEVFSNASKDTR